jgi:hypothetical protein
MNRCTALRCLGGLVLAFGLCGSVLQYQKGVREAEVLAASIASGGEVLLHPEDYKKSTREMEVFGGSSLVLVDKLQRWFGGLWEGKSLAVIMALCTVAVAALLFRAANHPPSGQPPEDAGGNDQDVFKSS